MRCRYSGSAAAGTQDDWQDEGTRRPHPANTHRGRHETLWRRNRKHEGEAKPKHFTGDTTFGWIKDKLSLHVGWNGLDFHTERCQSEKLC